MSSSSKDIQLRELKDTISELRVLVKSLQATIDNLNAREAALQTERDNLKGQVDYLTQKLFGKRSEKGFDIPGQYNFFNELEIEADESASDDDNDDKSPDDDETARAPKKRKPRRTKEELFKGIPVKKEYLDIPEDQRFCKNCGAPLEYIGEEVVRRELDIIPAKVRVIEYCSRNYKCPKDCKDDYTLPSIVKGKDGKPHMLHGLASSSTIAWIIYQKFVNSLPLYRQEMDWKRQGVALERSTTSTWIIKNAEEYFKPLYEFFRRILLTRRFLMADETPVQVLKEPERRPEAKSFMWLFRTGERDDKPIVLFKYSETRAGDTAKDYLEDFDGYIMCDGYSGYNKLKKAKRCCCWAHIRRYMIDAIPKGKKNDHSHPPVQGLLYIEKLFRIERVIKEKGLKDEEAVRLARLKHAPEILENFFTWVDAQRPVKGSRFAKAITYIQNRRPYLETYLENGYCSFHNNLSELSIKNFVIGRKNWLFSDTPKGAESSAIIYSIVETAKANEVNVYHYLKYLLDVLPSIDLDDEAELEKAAPWNSDLKATIKEIEINSIM